MNADVCETCGHAEMGHVNGPCIMCKADHDCDPKVEICQEFKPDAFDMWKEEIEEDDE